MRAEHGPAGGPCCPRPAPPRPRASVRASVLRSVRACRPLQPRPSCRAWLVQGLVRFCPLRPRPLAEAGGGGRQRGSPALGPRAADPQLGPPGLTPAQTGEALRRDSGLRAGWPGADPHGSRTGRPGGHEGLEQLAEVSPDGGQAARALPCPRCGRPRQPARTCHARRSPVPREPHGDACGAAVRAGPLLCGRDPLGRRLSGLLKEKHQFLKREKK